MKLIITIILLFIAMVSLAFGIDENALKIHDEAFERAMIAFGLAKGLNAVISVIQGTELSFAPVGIGLTFTIGEVLDPFNDMVERFSWVMLLASVSLGIQKTVLILSSKVFLQFSLALSIFISLSFIWSKALRYKNIFIVSLRFLILLLILRFAAVLFVYSSELLYNSVLANEFHSSKEVLNNTKERLEDIQNKNKDMLKSKKESAWYELDVTSKYKDLKSKLNISKQLESLQQSIEDASKKIISLITIFVIESVLMPLLFLWILIAGIKWTFQVRFDEKTIALLLR